MQMHTLRKIAREIGKLSTDSSSMYIHTHILRSYILNIEIQVKSITDSIMNFFDTRISRTQSAFNLVLQGIDIPRSPDSTNPSRFLCDF